MSPLMPNNFSKETQYSKKQKLHNFNESKEAGNNIICEKSLQRCVAISEQGIFSTYYCYNIMVKTNSPTQYKCPCKFDFQS